MFSFSLDGTQISFSPIFAGAAQGSAKANHMQYVNVATDTDLTYGVSSKGLKETLILKSANALASYSYKLGLQNLTYQAQTDGSISFYKSGSQTPLFNLAKPFMIDANQVDSTAASYQIQQDALGNTFIHLVIDPTWLKDPKRAFPVALDPSIFVQNGGNVDDTFIGEATPTEL